MPINQMPPDGGMLYKETDMAQFFPATARILRVVVCNKSQRKYKRFLNT